MLSTWEAGPQFATRRRTGLALHRLVAVLLAVAGAVILAAAPWQESAERLAMRDWPTAPAVIEAVELREIAGTTAGGGVDVRLAISARYAYQAAGRSFEGRAVSLQDVAARDDRRLRSLHRKLHFARVTGRTVDVRYDPAAPERAFVDVETSWTSFLVQFSIGATLFAAGLCLHLRVRLGTRRRVAGGATTQS